MVDNYQPDEPYRLHCPLCEHGLQVAGNAEDMCAYCGAEIAVFDDMTVANQFAETCKARGESVHWSQAANGPVWVVAHKASPNSTVI